MLRAAVMLLVAIALLTGMGVTESLASAGTGECQTVTQIVCNQSPAGSGVFTCHARVHVNANCADRFFDVRLRLQCFLNGNKFGPQVVVVEATRSGTKGWGNSPSDSPRPTGMGVTYTYTAETVGDGGSSSATPVRIP